MEKVCCEMKCFETGDGFRVEVKGKEAKNWLSCCGGAKEATK